MNRRTATTIALACLGVAGPAQAQRQGQFEDPKMDWGPNAAWRAKARTVRENRWRLIRQGDIGRLNGGQFVQSPGPLRAPVGSPNVVTGQLHLPVIPISYTDLALPYSQADYQAVLFGDVAPNGRPYTVRTYYRELSGARLLIDGQIMAPVRATNTATFYEQGCNGYRGCPDNGQRMGDLFIQTVDSISKRPGGADVWSSFDNDGPDLVPNSGDDDGEVDFVVFLQPRVGGECNNIPSPGIWSHKGRLQFYNGNAKYVTKTPRKNAAGQPIPGQFLTVNSYIVQSGLGGADACTGTEIMPPAVMIHESGHAFGLPDLYDTSFDGEGLGEWSVMASGTFTSPMSPSSYDAWSLNELGWVAVDTIGGTRQITTRARATADTVFLVKLSAADQYLLIENRQAAQSDTSLLSPGRPTSGCVVRCQKLPGLLLYHIDLTRIAAGRSTNRVNIASQPGVALIQADGRSNLEGFNGFNRGDGGDSYPGSTDNREWNVRSNPAARTNQAAFAGFVIDRIEQLPNQVVRFRVVNRQPSVFATSVAGTTILVNGAATTRFAEVIAAGDTVALAADSLHPINEASRYRFSSWSKGGARSQAFISGATPDTVTAGFVTELRLRVAKAGTSAGALSANQPGDLSQGLFVTTGTAITLKASSPPGVTFAGWAGDTTATDSSLVVPMARPYQLEATFAGEIIPVALEDATTDLLGTPKLTALEKVALDFQGNKNNRYDLGDYLAMLKRQGLAIPPAILDAVAEGKLGSAAAPATVKKGN